MIEPKAKQILEETFQDVLTMLGLPPLPYTFVYEKMGGRFLTMENSEEVDNTNHIIYVQRNLGGNTVLPYQRQPVEVDANAFANFYVLVKGIGGARVPAESDDLVTQRLKEIAAQYGMVIK